jgi:hypothetical protein
MMERHLPRSPIWVAILPMFVRSSEIKKAISGSVAVVAFGAMTAVHLPITRRILLGMSTKIKKATSGPVHKPWLVHKLTGVGYFPGTMKRP